MNRAFRDTQGQSRQTQLFKKPVNFKRVLVIAFADRLILPALAGSDVKVYPDPRIEVFFEDIISFLANQTRSRSSRFLE